MPYLSGYEAPPPVSWPPPFAPPPPPDPAPIPALKVVREWEGVGVWPVATPPPPRDTALPLPTASAECLSTATLLGRLSDGNLCGQGCKKTCL